MRERIKAGHKLDMARQVKSQLLLDDFDAKYFPERKKKKIERIQLSVFVPLYLEHYLKVKAPRSWRSAENRLKNIQSLLDDKYLDEISTKDIHFMLKKLSLKGDKRSTLNRYRSQLNVLYKIAIKWGNCLENPVDGVEKYPEGKLGDRYLLKHEYQQLLNALPKDIRNLVEIAAHTGMRQGEIMNLKWGDVDLDSKFLVVRHENAKTEEYRRIPMHERLHDLFTALPENDTSVWHYRNFPYDRWHRVIKELKWHEGEVSRIRGWRFHDLRHHFASWLVMENVSLHRVGKLLGHKTVETTMRYAHLADASLVNAVDRLDYSSVSVPTNREALEPSS